MSDQLSYKYSTILNINNYYIKPFYNIRHINSHTSFCIKIDCQPFKIIKLVKDKAINEYYISAQEWKHDQNFLFLAIKKHNEEAEIIYSGTLTFNDLVKFNLGSVSRFQVGFLYAKEWIQYKKILLSPNSINDYFIFASSSKLPDIKLKINTQDGSYDIMCHSEYLINSCQLFKSMFESKFEEFQTKEISLDIEYKIMIILYQYFYLKQLDPEILKKENLSLCIDLYIKANEYQVNILKDVLKASICSNIDTNNIDLLMNSKLLEQNDDLDGLLPKIIRYILNKI